MPSHPNYARATDQERRSICRHCGGNLDGSISHVDAVCVYPTGKELRNHVRLTHGIRTNRGFLALKELHGNLHKERTR
jgi:hypothetical protein